MSKEAPQVNILEKDESLTPTDFDALLKHFDKLGLNSKCAFVPAWVSWARFEIIENNDSVEIEVDREDGTTVRCYLCRGFQNPDRIHFQVTSGIKADHTGFYDEEYPDHLYEVDGIFPLEIKSVYTTASSLNGYMIVFSGSHDGKGGIAITEYGRVRFTQ